MIQIIMIVTTLLPAKPLWSQLDFRFFSLVDQLNYANEARVKWRYCLSLCVSIFCQLQLHHRLLQIQFLFGLKCQHKIFFKAFSELTKKNSLKQPEMTFLFVHLRFFFHSLLRYFDWHLIQFGIVARFLISLAQNLIKVEITFKICWEIG